MESYDLYEEQADEQADLEARGMSIQNEVMVRFMSSLDYEG